MAFACLFNPLLLFYIHYTYVYVCILLYALSRSLSFLLPIITIIMMPWQHVSDCLCICILIIFSLARLIRTHNIYLRNSIFYSVVYLCATVHVSVNIFALYLSFHIARNKRFNDSRNTRETKIMKINTRLEETIKKNLLFFSFSLFSLEIENNGNGIKENSCFGCWWDISSMANSKENSNNHSNADSAKKY